ncbi:MAG: ChbG/HpnK family deacetylase [Nitrospiraceae bacterium]|nr:ChbG/HpnK family deacetylase [Nitrospiraceae bacterium]
MIIVNADDWGRTRRETNAALACFRERRITSVTAMVFMEDSARAADLARQERIDVGLHLNLSQPFTQERLPGRLREYHERICRYLNGSKYAMAVYNPVLRNSFRAVYRAQADEFFRLYGRLPSHVDGHHHHHLCANMLWDDIYDEGLKVRRNFSFRPGEKSMANRMYRRLADRCLGRRCRMTDYFYALSQHLPAERLGWLADLAKTATVELMSHPANDKEYTCLMSDGYQALMAGVEKGTYTQL